MRFLSWFFGDCDEKKFSCIPQVIIFLAIPVFTLFLVDKNIILGVDEEGSLIELNTYIILTLYFILYFITWEYYLLKKKCSRKNKKE